MGLGEGQQMAVRHVERTILVDSERARMLPRLSLARDAYGDFLYPAHRIETPFLKIRGDRFLDPADGAAPIFFPPDVNVLGVSQARRIDVVEPHRKERFAVRSNQPPMVFPLAKCEEAVRLRLRCWRVGDRPSCKECSG